jgi:hypothetical protein
MYIYRITFGVKQDFKRLRHVDYNPSVDPWQNFQLEDKEEIGGLPVLTEAANIVFMGEGRKAFCLKHRQPKSCYIGALCLVPRIIC